MANLGLQIQLSTNFSDVIALEKSIIQSKDFIYGKKKKKKTCNWQESAHNLQDKISGQKS